MQTTQEIFQKEIIPLADEDKLEIASLILQNLMSHKSRRANSAVDILSTIRGNAAFKTPQEADEYLREERNSWER